MLSYYWFKILTKLRGSAVKNSKISKKSKVEAGSIVVNSSMDRYSYCGYNCLLSNADIGAFSSISDDVVIGGGIHPLNWVSTSPAFYRGRDSISKRLAQLDFNYSDPKTVIGNDVWIGNGVHVKAGITIGNGAVIGMGSVVTKDVEPYSVVAGNPAREIRKRFDECTVRELEAIEWWNLNESEIYSFSGDFNDVEKFIKKWKERKESVSIN